MHFWHLYFLLSSKVYLELQFCRYLISLQYLHTLEDPLLGDHIYILLYDFFFCRLTIISCNILIVKTSNAAKHSSKEELLVHSIKKSITSFFFCPPDKNFAFISFKLSNSNLEIK